MKRLIEGEARSQCVLFAKRLDDYVAADDPVRAIRVVCREFVVLCRRLELFAEAIDGSKFKAVNNRDKNFTDRKLKARMEQLARWFLHSLGR